MRSLGRTVLIPVGVLSAALLAALLAALISLTFFLNGSGLRSEVESTLSRALGRKVTIGRLELSLASASLLADHMTIADADGFGSQPFAEAKRVRMGIDVMPLLLRRQIRLRRFVFEQPAVHLERSARGEWNYASLGRHPDGAERSAGRPRELPDLAVTRVVIEDASLSVELDSAIEPPQTRLYTQVDVDLHDFSLTRAFPFHVSAKLPADGSVQASGSIGPIGGAGHPLAFSAHVETSHLDLQPAGIVTPASGISALIDHLSLDLTGAGDALRVSSLTAQLEHLDIVRTPAAPGGDTARRVNFWTDLLDHLAVEQAQVQIATLAYNEPGKAALVFHAIDAHLQDWAFAALPPTTLPQQSPFTVTALVPGEGQVRAEGQAAFPRRLPNGARSGLTLDARVDVRHLDLAHSGLLAANSAIAGSVDADVRVGLHADASFAAGTATVTHLKLAHNGQPAPRPVSASFALRQEPGGGEGVSTQGDLQHVVLSLGEGAAVDLQVRGDALPIDAVESLLPVVGVQLPEGSRLAGGALSLAVKVAGPVSNLSIDGPVSLANTRLNGFDLGARLASLARFTGGRIGSATVSGTGIRSLRLDLHSADGVIHTGNLAFDVAGIGPGTGSGSIARGGALNFKLSLKLSELVPGTDGGAGLARQLAAQLPPSLAGLARNAIDSLAAGPMKNGIPILVGGTAQHPTITPNLGALLPAERPRR
jgi:hypothetical protein